MGEDVAARADAYVARAAAESGLLPRGAEQLMPGLRQFLDGFELSATPTATGRVETDRLIVDLLIARFRIEDWIARHPAVLDAPIEKPVFILGFPRAGSTMLVNLLARDPQRRFYWTWEQNCEAPPLSAAERADNARLRQKRAEIEAALATGALDHRQHVEMADQPAECVMLLGQAFKGYVWLTRAQSAAYFDYFIDETDMVEAYRHHKRALQVMQSGAAGKWLLKMPNHAMAIDAILQVYPDARIVVTHRDPACAIPSSCDAELFFTALCNDNLDLHQLGRQSIRLMKAGFDRIDVARARYPQTPFYDFHFRRFSADPIAEVRRLYAFLGDSLTPDVEQAMRDELAAALALRAETGAHHYALETFGLSRDAIHATFADYIRRYEVELEPA